MRVVIMRMINCHVRRSKCDGYYISVHSNLKCTRNWLHPEHFQKISTAKLLLRHVKKSGELLVDRRRTSAGVK